MLVILSMTELSVCLPLSLHPSSPEFEEFSEKKGNRMKRWTCGANWMISKRGCGRAKHDVDANNQAAVENWLTTHCQLQGRFGIHSGTCSMLSKKSFDTDNLYQGQNKFIDHSCQDLEKFISVLTTNAIWLYGILRNSDQIIH